MILRFSHSPLVSCLSPKTILLAEDPVFQDNSAWVARKKFWGHLHHPTQSTVTSYLTVQAATSSLTHQQPLVPALHLSQNGSSPVAGRHRNRQVNSLGCIHCSSNPSLENSGERAGSIPQTKPACRQLAWSGCFKWGFLSPPVSHWAEQESHLWRHKRICN